MVWKYMLNMMNYALDEWVRQLKDDSSKALEKGGPLVMRVIRKNGALCLCNLRQLRILFVIKVDIQIYYALSTLN